MPRTLNLNLLTGQVCAKIAVGAEPNCVFAAEGQWRCCVYAVCGRQEVQGVGKSSSHPHERIWDCSDVCCRLDVVGGAYLADSGGQLAGSGGLHECECSKWQRKDAAGCEQRTPVTLEGVEQVSGHATIMFYSQVEHSESSRCTAWHPY